jgi:hypothetical protein
MLTNYIKLHNGVIKQDKIVHCIKTYDINYTSDYNKYGELGRNLGFLRLGFLIGSLGIIPDSILDVGYGNGDFLKAATLAIKKCYGTDLVQTPLPNNVTFLKFNDAIQLEYDVITFFDSLEHFENIDFVKDLKCKYIFITLPWCHYIDNDWFENWKHRKPDEHLWHFDKNAMLIFFREHGYECVNIGCPFEDTIRKDNNYTPNILTGIFKKVSI